MVPNNAPEQEWQTVASFSDVLSAHVVAERLIAEGVPVCVKSGSQLLGESRSCEVQAPSAIAHRARWLLAAAQFTDEELNYLATGELGSNNE
jgi:hypothetical protein